MLFQREQSRVRCAYVGYEQEIAALRHSATLGFRDHQLRFLFLSSLKLIAIHECHFKCRASHVMNLFASGGDGGSAHLPVPVLSVKPMVTHIRAGMSNGN